MQVKQWRVCGKTWTQANLVLVTDLCTLGDQSPEVYAVQVAFIQVYTVSGDTIVITFEYRKAFFSWSAKKLRAYVITDNRLKNM